MAKDAAIVFTWGGPVTGRENKSLEVFMETLSFYAQKAGEGTVSEPETYLAEDGSGGMLIVKGKSDALRELEETAEARKLLAKAHTIVNDLKAHWYYTGDEIQNETSLFAEVSSELGL
jgi:hypothetical protein